jgi:hypothetical protein
LSRRRQCAIVTSVALCALLLAYLARATVLQGLGSLLVAADAPKHADILMVVRGDEVRYERALTAATLFHAGYADRIYVSSALNDLPVMELARNVKLPTPQDKCLATGSSPIAARLAAGPLARYDGSPHSCPRKMCRACWLLRVGSIAAAPNQLWTMFYLSLGRAR